MCVQRRGSARALNGEREALILIPFRVFLACKASPEIRERLGKRSRVELIKTLLTRECDAETVQGHAYAHPKLKYLVMGVTDNFQKPWPQGGRVIPPQQCANIKGRVIQ